MSNKELRAEVEKAIGGDWQGGLKVQVTDVGRTGPAGDISPMGADIPPNVTWVEATLTNAAGDEGYLRGWFYQQPNGKLVAYHDYLTLPSATQGAGFSTDLMDNMFTWYKRSGVTSIDVRADIDVGGYTWARMGWDFKSVSERKGFGAYLEKLLDRTDRWLVSPRAKTMTFDQILHEVDVDFGLTGSATRVGLDNPLSPIDLSDYLAQRDLLRAIIARIRAGEKVSAMEISQVGRALGQGGKDAQWIGKWAMLGTDWEGSLRVR